MRKQFQSRERQSSISAKVKKMFRYSPSFEAQKCHSKLPLRYSYASSINRFSERQNQINCEYSSVKEKNIETNQCNDTSSWIAKLVSGIQDEDDENRNLNKLSQIENNDLSVNDLPEDSQDYTNYNQFLDKNTIGKRLFTDNQDSQKKKKQNPNKFEKETVITRPMKKSIKQAMIQIELKQNKQGLKVPPVTRANSVSKKQQQKKTSKKISNEKTKGQRQNSSHKKKSSEKKKEVSKKIENKVQKYLVPSNRSKSQANKKMKTSSTQQKQTQKSMQFDHRNSSFSVIHSKSQSKQFNYNSTTQKQDRSQKPCPILSNTKKHSICKIHPQNEDYPTRKNSFITKQELSQCKQQFKIVEQHSKHLQMKKLFEEESSAQIQQNFNFDKNFQTNQSETKSNQMSQKKVGGIKKNIIVKNDQNMIRKQNKSSFDLSTTSRQELNANQIQFQVGKNINQIRLKYDYLSGKRQSGDYPISKRVLDKRIFIDLEDDFLSSNRNLGEQTQIKRQPISKEKDKKTLQIKPKDIAKERSQRSWMAFQKNQMIQKENRAKLEILFNKIKLNPSNPLLSKTNIKLRGLTEQQKTQLGSIITKVHYQNLTFDLQSFINEFTRINAECTMKGCLSQEKLRNVSEAKRKEIQSQKQKPMKMKENNDRNMKVEKVQPIKKEENEQNGKVGHRRRNSRAIKNELFEQIKRISYLEEIAQNQLEMNSRLVQDDRSKVKNIQKQQISLNKQLNQLQQSYQQQISRQPYIQGPSLLQIQLTSNRQMLTLPSSKMNTVNIELKRQTYNNVINPLSEMKQKQFQNLPQGQNTCLIERLNQKLTTYIDKNHIQSTYRQFNLNFSQLKKHIR